MRKNIYHHGKDFSVDLTKKNNCGNPTLIKKINTDTLNFIILSSSKVEKIDTEHFEFLEGMIWAELDTDAPSLMLTEFITQGEHLCEYEISGSEELRNCVIDELLNTL